jgi:uracil-DNA glycosylase
MDKTVELEKLKQKIIKDKSLPLQESNLVFGEGSPDCAILFIGEAPGFNEDVQKRPFVGRAGQLLRLNIRELGWEEEDVYITNIVKRRPPENRDPNEEEIKMYKPYLAKQIEIINPKIIVPLGRFSMNYFLTMAKITRDQGKLFKVEKYNVLTILHPAAALRGNEAMKMFKETFKKLPAALDKISKGEFKEAKHEESVPQQKFEDVQSRLF